MTSPRKRIFAIRKRIFAVLLCALAPVAGWPAWVYASGNIHRVEPDIYRSGQLTPPQLEELIQTTGIRSILNLRGEHRGESWWREENRVAASYGVIYKSIPISARSVPDLATMNEIASMMKDLPKPILVHCKAGADRSGLASAIYVLAVDGADAKTAAEQLSLRYGHFPWFGNQTAAMDQAFATFAASRRDTRSAAAETRAPSERAQ